MVRLVILMLLSLLAACSSQPPKPVTVSEHALPAWEEGELASLSAGRHHPAVASLFAQAETARQRGALHKALTYLDQARQIEPRNPAILYRQAWVQLQLGNAYQAQQLLQRGQIFARSDPAMMRRMDALLAESLALQGKAQEAQAARQRATGLQ